MKKINLMLVFLFVSVLAVFAQSNKEEVDLYQSLFGGEKKAVVAEFIKLDGEAGTAFWDLYDKYETARKEHGQKRLVLLEKYVENFKDLGEDKTKEIMKEMISLGDDYNKLIKKYYKSISKACGAKAGGQFYQLETYFQSGIRMVIMEGIPFIGELD
jgi:hypothetical protein